MRKYKTSCSICGKETRNKGIGIKPIDCCSVCIKLAEKDKKRNIPPIQDGAEKRILGIREE